MRNRLLTLLSWSVAVGLTVATIKTAVDRAGPFPDLDVYRVSARAVGRGSSLYDVRGANGGPFTYPPFAAFVLWPMTAVSLVWAGVLLAAATCVAGVVTARLVLRDRPWWLVGAVCACAIEMVPFRTTIYFGQIGAVLMVMVAADLLFERRPWAGGLLIGIAAAIKLTPLIFVPYLVVAGRRREARTAAVTFVVATVVGAIAAPAASWRYWSSALWESKRVGDIASIHNRSVWGTVATIAPRWMGLLLALVLGVVGLWLFRRADRATAFAAVGLLSCLVSPIAWSHHLVWVLPAIALLAVASWPAYVRITSIALVTLAFARFSSDQRLLALLECSVAVVLVGVLAADVGPSISQRTDRSSAAKAVSR